MGLQSPFPYFGGKREVAALVWQALGQPKHYLEPFFGSGAVLLARPGYDSRQHVETVVDIDGHICNVWRALQADPEAVARWVDWPVNHLDLAARRKVLLAEAEALVARLSADDRYYEPRLAGYWIWAAACWIGSDMVRAPAGEASLGRRAHVATEGMGGHALGKRPHVSRPGMGVHALRVRSPAREDIGAVQAPYNTSIVRWFRALAARLRYVRVVCGDWSRVCGGRWQDLRGGEVGIFFDPPYDVPDRDHRLYAHDGPGVSQAVLAWARERGALPQYRIVIAGYEEYLPLLEAGWRVHAWATQGGYSHTGQRGTNRNRFREKLYCSPYCSTQLALLL
jgi:DNA adenine methylase